MPNRALIVLGGLTLAACGGGGGGGEAEAPKKAEVPATLPAGTYEVTATVKSLASTDETPVATFAKAGDTMKTQGCVGTDGLPAPELLAAKGDVCELQNPYVRGGRMNVTLDCNRKGQGKVMNLLNGQYTADGFTGELTASSSFAGSGDYKLVEEIVARKISDQCTAAPASASEEKA